MAIPQYKKINLKMENSLSSGDYIINEIGTKFNKNLNLSRERELGKGDENMYDLKIETTLNAADDESAYEESFCSDVSDEESELSNIKQAFESETPLCRFTSSKSLTKNPINSNKKLASTSKFYDDESMKLENQIKSMSLNDIRPTKSVHIHSTRKNMSFTNDEIIRIERDNEILLRKIMAQQKTQKLKIKPTLTKLSSSAINRKKLQKKIEQDNMILLQRLQQAKSCARNTNKVAGYRATYL